MRGHLDPLQIVFKVKHKERNQTTLRKLHDFGVKIQKFSNFCLNSAKTLENLSLDMCHSQLLTFVVTPDYFCVGSLTFVKGGILVDIFYFLLRMIDVVGMKNEQV